MQPFTRFSYWEWPITTTPTTAVVCPFCERANIDPNARFCDRCGNDISTFWKTVAPLLRQVSDQQIFLEEQSKTAQALKERFQILESTLSDSIPRSELDAATSKAQVRS